NAVSNQNVNLPTGVLWGPTKAYTVQANGQLQNAADFKRLVVTYRNGSPVRLGDLGTVLDDVQNNKAELAARHAGDRARRAAPAGHEHGAGRGGGEGTAGQAR